MTRANIRKMSHISAVIFTMFLLLACNKEEPQLMLSSSLVEVDYTAQTMTVDLQTNQSWQLYVSDVWLTVQPTSGEGDDQLLLSIPTWEGDEDRSVILTVKAGDLIRTVTISQKAIICSLSESSIVLDHTGNPRKVLLSSSVPWTVEVPIDATWLQITPNSGPAAQEIELTCQVQPNEDSIRQSQVAIQCGIRTMNLTVIQKPLTVPEYTYTVLQEHTKGTYPNEVIILGDGYSEEEYSREGSFNRDARDAMEAFFSIEPFRTYRSYFRVAQFVVYSPESGITENDKNTKVSTAFDVCFEKSSVVSLNNTNKVFYTVMRHIPDMTSERLRNTLLIVLANIDRYGGICWQYDDGSAIAVCGVARTSIGGYTTLADLIRHEAGGHGFGRLADEYVTHKGQRLPENATAASPYYHKQGLRQRQYYGYASNVDVGGVREEASWAYYYTLPEYQVGYYEGAYYFELGAWRPEDRSCMVDNRPYYNAPSRESIVKLLLRRAAGVRLCDYEYQPATGTFELVPIPDDPFNMEDFIRNDVKKAWSAPMLAPPDTRGDYFFIPTSPAIFVSGSPTF